MINPTICIIDRDLPLNEDFYERLMVKAADEGIAVSYCKELEEVPNESGVLLLASAQGMQGVENDKIVLGLRTINRKERLEIAAQVVPESLMARWAAPENQSELTEVLQNWGRSDYVFKYDWSAGRRGVMLLNHEADTLPEDYDPEKDIVMDFLDDDPYTYKADLCCGVLLNAWFLRTESITADNFNAYTKKPTQYTLPEEDRIHLERLSSELMRYGSGYISIDMMKYQGELKIIEINTNSVGRNISWGRFGDTYLETYPEGLKQLLANLSSLPRLGELRRLRNQPNKIMAPINRMD